MTSVAARSLRVGSREYPVVLPSIRDPRLHLASVIITLHILGQVALGFRVSIAQILVAIATCAAIELAVTFRRTGALIWPASALLTGSGVALILRVLGTENGEYWSLRGWYLFAIVAGASLVSKYVIRYQGSHVFNPSNFGLVVAFMVLGSGRVEPLDFWWVPFGLAMAAAYGVILAGGLFITARLRLIGMAVAFWVTLGAAMGVLAGSGHCVTARWAFEPVCGAHFWWIIFTSPEIMIFLFFMIPDPKTVPAGRVARVGFGVAVALLATLLIAPWQTEFGAKVALLAALVIMTGVRPLFERLFPEAGSEEDHVGRYIRRLLAGGRPDRALGPAIARGATVVATVAVLAVGVVAAGAPAREPSDAIDVSALPDVSVAIDPSSLPAVTVDPEVADLSSELAGPGAQDLATALATGLATEARALRSGDRAMLAGVDSGPRLAVMEERFDLAIASGQTVVSTYEFDSLHMVITFPFGEQGGAIPGLEALGTLEDVTYAADGGEVDRATSPYAITFSLRQAPDGRWLIVHAVPIQA